MLRASTIIIILGLLLGGCSTLPHDELQTARLAFARATVADAGTLAPQTFNAAEKTLFRAEELIKQGEYDEARKILLQAELLAQDSIDEAENVRTQIEHQRQRQEEQALILKIQQEKRRKAIEAEAQKHRQEERFAKPIPPAPKVVPKPEPKPKPKPLTHYTVNKGETLWTIASQERVYNDSLLWPLLYKANRDQIKDPRQIYPGQVLSIPRNAPEDELQSAREEAMKSTVFPVDKLMKTPHNIPD